MNVPGFGWAGLRLARRGGRTSAAVIRFSRRGAGTARASRRCRRIRKGSWELAGIGRELSSTVVTRTLAREIALVPGDGVFAKPPQDAEQRVARGPSSPPPPCRLAEVARRRRKPGLALLPTRCRKRDRRPPTPPPLDECLVQQPDGTWMRSATSTSTRRTY